MPTLAPASLPLLGHLLPLARDPLAFLESLRSQGEIVRIRLGPQEIHVICDPDLVHRLLRDDRTFDKGGPVFDRARDGIGNGLITCPHRDHREQRRRAQPAFHHPRIPVYARVMTQQVDQITARWRHGDLDALAETRRIAFGSLLRTLFDTEPAAEYLDRLALLLHTMVHGLYWHTIAPSPSLTRIPVRANRSFQQAQRELSAIVDQLIVDSRDRAAEGSHRDSLLSRLVEAGDAEATAPNDGEPRDGELRDQVLNILAGGTDSTGSALAWALHLISTHPEVQDALASEAVPLLGARPATWEDIPHLPATTSAVKEVLRLYPPGWMATRSVTTDTHLGSTALPQGSTVLFSAYILGRDPDLYERPHAFEPGRWNDEPGLQTRAHHFPFSVGPRNCIGTQFAMTELVLAVATVVSRWRLIPTGHRVKAAARMVLCPRALTLRVEPQI